MAEEKKTVDVKTKAVKAVEQTGKPVNEHIKRKFLNFDKNGMTGRRTRKHKENLNKMKSKGVN